MERPLLIEELSDASREAAARRREEVSSEALIERAERWWEGRGEGCFAKALEMPGLSVIAEYKRRSPAEGGISTADVAEMAEAYGSAAAVSVLTAEHGFDGSLEDLARWRELTDQPLLRKDFITDSYQLLEPKAFGADAVLLIAGILDDSRLYAFRRFAGALRLDVIVEVHDREELGRAIRSGARIIGINNRDLRAEGLPTDIGVTGGLLEDMPAGKVLVTESGYDLGANSRQRLRKYNARGVDAVLIGTELMRSDRPAEAIGSLQRGGTSRRQVPRSDAH